MRLLRLLLLSLLFAAGEVAVPVVTPASEAVEEAAEETPHASGRRRTERAPAAERAPSLQAQAVCAVHRPVMHAVSVRVELNRRASHRKVPPPSFASPSAPEDH